MNPDSPAFEKTSIRPFDCFGEAVELLKGQYWLFVGICLVGMLISSLVPLAILMGPMLCGIYLCYFDRMRGHQVRFGRLFDGFDVFVQSLIPTAIVTGATLVVMVPMYVLFMVATVGAMHGVDQDKPAAVFGILLPMMGFFYLALMVLGILVGVFVFFTYPLIVDRGMNGLAALGLSIRAAGAHLGGLLGLMVLNMLLGLAGALCCYVGMAFVFPLTFGAMAVAYRRVFPDPGKTDAPTMAGSGLPSP